MSTLHERLEALVPGMREELAQLARDHGDRSVGSVKIAHILGGMRGLQALICDTSRVEPEDGLIIRNRPIRTLVDHPPESIFYLLLTGEEPDDTALAEIQMEMDARAGVPDSVWDLLRTFPADAHPMAMLNAGILGMEHLSRFREAYDQGLSKTDAWKPALEDALALLPRVAELAAGLYRIRYGKGDPIPWTPGLDLGANFARMMGIADDEAKFASLMRLYLTLHSDHGGGNVSNFTCLTVGSALSDPYYAVAAGLNGLAGPLHGLANQESLRWLLGVMEEVGGRTPTADEMRKATWATLEKGRVVPGYGHGVLRGIDPRFEALFAWGKENLPEDPVYKTVAVALETIPEVLKEHGKAKNPWPNVDAGSGALLYHHGLTEFQYYTVLFGVSRTMGMASQLVLNRAAMAPITRPKAVERAWIRVAVGPSED